MVTFHPTAKKVDGGFVAMVTLRGDKGRMIGARVPRVADREVFETADLATVEARCAALRAALQAPEFIRVAE